MVAGVAGGHCWSGCNARGAPGNWEQIDELVAELQDSVAAGSLLEWLQCKGSSGDSHECEDGSSSRLMVAAYYQ